MSQDTKTTVANQEPNAVEEKINLADTIKDIEIKIKECVVKDGSNRKFNAYKALDKKTGKWIDCKFRKHLTPPTSDGFIKVYLKDINVAKNTQYPCLWVADIIEFESKEERVDKAVNEKDLNKLNEMF